MKTANHKRGAEISIRGHGEKYQETMTPEKPTKASLNVGRRRRAVEIISEARDLGNELMDEWEK
ncbi:MAG: hypothetical protein N0E44_22865 [Candidatus Thiodiazotropha lotti]|nr:hypothetical protein [Candidatus Thiodiazotropha lotti]MCW4222712.1 hypothetical protein [Candidatus Thiodiazotropha lotti]